MSGEKNTGFLVSQGRIALLLSMLTLFGVIYQAAGFMQSTQYRIEGLERSQMEVIENLGGLRNVINELNITLREVQVRQESK